MLLLSSPLLNIPQPTKVMQFGSTTELNAEAANAAVQGTLLAQVTQKSTRTTKNGKPYLEIVLADAAGTISFKIWETSPWYMDFDMLVVPASVAVTGQWQLSQYGMELADANVRPLSPEEEEQVLTGSQEMLARQQADWDTICSFVSGMKDPRLAGVCGLFLQQQEKRFRRAAAARNFHHARRGGLVEHAASVMRVADALCSIYPDRLNRDLVLAGALLHDCGKILENNYEEHSLEMPYSEYGELLGHIPLGIEIINKLWRDMLTPENQTAWKTLVPSTEQVRLHLLHLVASHHGLLEYGSPVLPKVPEALILHHADNVDAKMEMFRATYEGATMLSDRVVQRKSPMQTNVVLPLPTVQV